MTAEDTLLNVTDLKMYFPVRKGFLKRVVNHVKAVDGVNLFIKKGETLGLVGESGCGKTSAGRAILRLIQPTGGKILFRTSRIPGSEKREKIINIATASPRELKALRRDMQIIFQDPYSSLNPRMTVEKIIGEPLRLHGINGTERRDRVLELLIAVGLDTDHMKRHPHEFSGGQRQRIGIARALVLNPQLIVTDEPVSALDVSIQAQVINLLQDLQSQFGLTYLFISHDLSVVKHISNRVAVMYLGKLVELAETDELFANPQHPYTEALMSAVPVPDPDQRLKRIPLVGDVPSPLNPPSGCHFHPRCSYAKDICKNEPPAEMTVGELHTATCHFADSLNLHPVRIN
jgi:peptide/nickel transport system ATP-binding protein